MSRTRFNLYSYSCDKPGCEEVREELAPSAQEADRLTRQAGWSLIGSGRGARSDRCPEHNQAAS